VSESGVAALEIGLRCLTGDLGYPDIIGDVRQSELMPFPIRDAETTDMDDLRGVFRRASLSNENDRGLLREHPEWLVLSDQGVIEGRTRVAVDDAGTVTGFATYLISDGVAELEDLFVDPPQMRQGIAAALVLDICARLHDLGFERLEVTANPHAMAFYERMEFVEVRTVDTSGYPASRISRPTGPADRVSHRPGD
jgi:GNAT superfamily N-acetyltransferase